MYSLLAMSGYSDEEIQKIGRWDSEAFKRYIRLGRVTRMAVAAKVARVIK